MRIATARWLVLLPALAGCWAQQSRPSPEAAYHRAISNPAFPKEGFGESFCWHAAVGLRAFVSGYQASGDTAWLDWGVKYYDFLIAKMETGPDGYKGWIGPYIYDQTVWCDVHVGDAILLDGLLAFSEMVLKDGTLAAKYGEAARRYVAVAESDVIEKWDARGTWYEDGPFGGYISWNRYCRPGDLKNWALRNDIIKSNLSLPFNKQEDMGAVAMKLYRITGLRKYRDKAEKIFALKKSRFQYFDDHYVWNYWEPLAPSDVDEPAGKTLHWIGVHPYRNYQSGEVAKIVEAYDTGIVFDRQDIERILNTNLKAMWNGDRLDPKFRNSNSTLPWPPGAAPENNTAGALWTALLPFSQTVRDLYEAQLRREGRGGREYFETVVKKTPPGFRRKYAAEPKALPAFPLHECPEVNFAAALPSVFRAGTSTLLMANVIVPGEIEIALYSAGGGKLERVLNRERRSGLVIYRWDGNDPEKAKRFRGDYRIRWTVGPNSYREFPVRVN
jgi:hypothetical protein